MLLDSVGPRMLDELLYLGSRVGLTIYRYLRRVPTVMLSRSEVLWFAGAVLTVGVVAPGLLMVGLSGMPASGASLLLNAEGVFTVLFAWFSFRENFDRRIALGMAAIVAGAVIISWPGEASFAGAWPALALLGACLAWGIENNLTRKVSLSDATWIASIKGLVAGTVNLVLSLTLGESFPPLPNVAGAMVVGLLAYGVSPALFVEALKHLGTVRTGAYFSVAPIFGAILAVAMGEPLSWRLLIAAALMGIGTWMHLTENHEHVHRHDDLTHDHEHLHDEHHQHEHEGPVALGIQHRHAHRHEAMTHSHAHFPDAHHRHGH